MGYFARTRGYLELKLPAKEIFGDFWNHLYDAVGSESYYMYSDDPTKIEVGDDTVNYDESRVLDALNAMKSYVVNGEIFYESDDERWKIKLVNGEWEEFSGRVVYEDEKRTPAIPKENQAESVGNVIDIIEDWLDMKGVIIPNDERDEDEEEISANIYGSDYDYLSGRFADTFMKWGIFEG